MQFPLFCWPPNAQNTLVTVKHNMINFLGMNILRFKEKVTFLQPEHFENIQNSIDPLKNQNLHELVICWVFAIRPIYLKVWKNEKKGSIHLAKQFVFKHLTYISCIEDFVSAKLYHHNSCLEQSSVSLYWRYNCILQVYIIM